MTKLKFGRHTSALKAHRQALKREKSNRALKDKLYFLERKVKMEIKKKSIENAKKILNEFISGCDKAAKLGIFHLNNASRQKSKLTTLVNRSAKV